MILEPLRPNPAAPLARAHPLVKLAGAVILLVALFVAVDPLTPALVLLGCAIAFPLSGLSFSAFRARLLPIALAALSLGVFTTLFGTEGLAGGIAIAMRVLAIAVSSLLSIATIDPTDLGDALIEHLHAPARFAIGALAAMRLVPLFVQEWETIGLARRARGIDDRASPFAALRGFRERSFALLVGAIRRATRLAMAMDARGFDAQSVRSLARPRPSATRDWMWLGAYAGLAAVATWISVAMGSWRFFVG